MIRQLLNRIIRRRHFWREAGFDELTELYVSSMLRTFALSVLMVFVPFYLYQLGYPIYQIFSFYGFYFGGKALGNFIASHFIARFGPKHSMVVSCGLQIIVAAMLLSLDDYRWPFWLLAPLFGAAASFFFIAFHVEFSMVKHALHAGKEIGNMQVFEKIAAITGPLVGGMAGSFLGPQYIFAVASGVLILSLWPLFRTAEPMRLRQKLNYRDLPVRKLLRDYTSFVGLGVETTLCGNLWPLYVSLFALSGSVYAQLGALSSFAVIASIIAAHFIGRYIDQSAARPLLRLSVVVNALVYVFRPMVHSLWPAFATNVVNEVVTTGCRLPYTKGLYARADELAGFRIVYVSTMEFLGDMAKTAVWWFMALLALSISVRSVMIVGFAIAGLASLLIATERFNALDDK